MEPDFEDRAHKIDGTNRNHVNINDIKIYTSILIQYSNWVQFLPQVLASYAMTPHTVTRHSPFELFFGRKPRRIIAIDSATIGADCEQYTEEQYLQEREKNSAKVR